MSVVNTPIIIKAESTIEMMKGKYSLDIDGSAGPHVSSGSRFGFGGLFDSREEAKKFMIQYLKDQREWFGHTGRIIKIKHSLTDLTEKQSVLV